MYSYPEILHGWREYMRRNLLLVLLSCFVFLAILSHSIYLADSAGNTLSDKIRKVSVYTTIPIEQAAVLAQEFEKEYHIQVEVVVINSQELRRRASQNELKGDVILADSAVLEEAKTINVLTPLSTDQVDELPYYFRDKDDYWIGTWFDPMVFAINQDFLGTLSAPILKWDDLNKDVKWRIAMTDFLASETSARILYTLAAERGEVQALAYLKKLQPQVVQYANLPGTPVRMAALKEVDIAVAPLSEALRYKKDSFPVKIIYPEDGTAFLLIGAGIVKGTQRHDDAGLFIEWLQKKSGVLLKRHKFYYSPTMGKNDFLDLTVNTIKLYNTKETLNKDQQKALLEKWIQNVRLATK
jgi:iron(III) transport system substrate-binding protein